MALFRCGLGDSKHVEVDHSEFATGTHTFNCKANVPYIFYTSTAQSSTAIGSKGYELTVSTGQTVPFPVVTATNNLAKSQATGVVIFDTDCTVTLTLTADLGNCAKLYNAI